MRLLPHFLQPGNRLYTFEFLLQEKYPLSCTTHGMNRSIFVEIFALDRNRIRYNVLLNACIYGHTEVVRLLLADPTVHPGDQESLSLQYACEQGHVEIVKLLLQSGKVDKEVKKGHPLRLALRNKHIEIVKILV